MRREVQQRARQPDWRVLWTMLGALATWSTAHAADAETVTLVAGGDVVYPSDFAESTFRKQRPKLWSSIRPVLDAADVRFCNLETPVTEQAPSLRKPFLMQMSEERLGAVVDEGRFNLISVANNHTADCGEQGLIDTLDALDRARERHPDLQVAGAGRTPDEVWRVAYFTPPGKTLKLALVAAGNNGSPLVANASSPKLLATIRAARKEADVVLVSVHGGLEYTHVPSPAIVKRYRSLIDAGADVVLGHHPHVPQSAEWYKRGVIFYSFGNLSFGSYTKRYRATGARMWGLLGEVQLAKTGVVRARAIPLWVNNAEALQVGELVLKPTPLVPQLLTGTAKAAMLVDLRTWNAELPGGGTGIDDDGVLQPAVSAER